MKVPASSNNILQSKVKAVPFPVQLFLSRFGSFPGIVTGGTELFNVSKGQHQRCWV